MNAKELRRQAEYLVEQWDSHDKFRTVEGDAAFMNADGEPDAVTFARHVLSTVLDDDDELVSEDWLSTVETSRPFITHVGSDVIDAHYWGFSTRHLWGTTRGQFRSLCKGLGIELKEKEAC